MLVWNHQVGDTSTTRSPSTVWAPGGMRISPVSWRGWAGRIDAS